MNFLDKFELHTDIRENDALRSSFNDMTRNIFDFDFTDWYNAGHWGPWYIPHALTADNEVFSNISVNLMRFNLNGVRKQYIQLGTVMTDELYRGRGLNRRIMEQILAQYAQRTDGIYLFANDEVLDYYPKFGFQSIKEYEYYLTPAHTALPYEIVPVDMNDDKAVKPLYELIRELALSDGHPDPNTEFYMDENISLYQFWLAAGYGECLYFLPEARAYVIAGLNPDEGILHLHQVFSKRNRSFCS